MMRFRFWMCSALLLGLPAAGFSQYAFYDSVHGIYWSQVAPPSGERFSDSQLVREGLGYLTDGADNLYEYDAARPQPWRRLPQPGQYKIAEYFALEADDIWAAVEVPEIFKNMLYHWDGHSWTPAFSQNVYSILNIYFSSPEEGWLACHYGEVWHYLRGQWQREKFPAFLHVRYLEPAPDGSLYAVCRAPQQGALLRRWQGEWQLVSGDFFPNLTAVSFTPSNRLIVTEPSLAPRRLTFGKQPAWSYPLRNVEFFSDGAGYGVDLSTIYAFQDTACTAIATSPIQLSEVRLFSKTFSWIVGAEGLVLMPQQHVPAAFPQPRLESSFQMLEVPVTRLYGLAVLQDRPAAPWRVHAIATYGPNVVFDPATFFPSREKPNTGDRFPDHALRLNLAGSENYTTRDSVSGALLPNFDQGVTTGDLNGDGRSDLIVTSMYGHPFVYFKSNREFYHDVTAFSGLKEWGSVRRRPMLATLFDADNDGDLDLFIACQYASNAFFVNDGRGRFTEMTQAAGLATTGGGIGGYPADFDGDGWQDLYVTCVSRTNLLYRNRGPEGSGRPRFEDVSASSGEACQQDLKESQGAAVADYDNDGDLDLFVCNRMSASLLLRNQGNGTFKDVTAAAGLARQDQSMGALFFDADLDGHLDLLVTNIGRNRFYKNRGDGSFVEQSSQFADWDGARNLMEASQRLGGNSTGQLAVDLDEDSDLDMLIANYDTGMFALRNGMDRRRSGIAISLEGILSNRSAVGSRVFLYEADSTGSPAKLVGQRLIESSSGFGSSPAKVAHFGVDSTKTYFARVYFPSGIVRELRGLRGGERRVAAELAGMGASVIKAKRTLADLFLGFRSRERYLVLLLGALILFLLVKFGRKYWGVAVHDVPRLAWTFGLSYWSSLILWLAESQLVFILRPLVIGTGLTLAAMLAIRFQRMRRARAASLEMLQVRLHAFDHGSVIHQLMNRLAFYLENLHTESAPAPAVREKLLQLARNTHSILKQEIDAILTYQYANNFAADLAHALERKWNQFRKLLHGLQRALQMDERPQPEVLAALRRGQEQIRAGIAELKQRLSAEYYADVPRVIADLLQQRESNGLALRPHPAMPRARIAAADLAYVLDELVSNSLRHLDGRPAQIAFELRHAYDEVHLEVHDNGAGIPRELWEEIFKPGFTTKAEGRGGFGLYHIRQRIEKAGGKIFVAESQPGGGTTMRICLKAEI
ncbi:MAG: hypothetical protein DKINENOH_02252 [bacterium]|nr:hypothetical protein [bacterium]